MSEQFQFLLLGVGGGSVIAVLALGIVLTYRASGVVNFAHASMGMFCAFVFNELRATGDLVFPVPWLNWRLPVYTAGIPGRPALWCCGIPTKTTALVFTLIYAAVLGLVVYLLVFRPLRHSPTLAKVVASIGLFLYFFAVADLQFGGRGAATGSSESLLPTSSVRFLGVTIPQDRLWLAGIVLLGTAALWAIFRYGRFGLSTRAAAENEKGAILIGLNPDRLAAINWMVAMVFAAGGVILFAPIAGLSPSSTSLLIVPALAAALVGGFSNFWLTVVGGLGIGMAQTWLLNVQTETFEWMPSGIQVGLPLALIVVIMAIRGESLPTRGSMVAAHYPRSPTPRAVLPTAALLSGLAVAVLLTGGSEWRQAIILTSIGIILSLSVVVLTGYVGQISLAPIAFAGISAFAMVKVSEWGVPFPLSALLGALVATGVGLLIGLPAVRVRGLNLAIATVAAAIAIEEIVLRWEWFTGGGAGTAVPTPGMAGVDLGIAGVGTDFPRAAFGMLCVVIAALCGIGVANIRRGTIGRQFLAVRANERAAAAVGIDVAGTKLLAFALSSFLAGIGGCLIAYQRQTLSASSFAVFDSLALLALTYLAGIASIGGAVVAGIMAQGGVLTVALNSDSSSQFALNGALLVVVSVLYPDGVTGAIGRLASRVRGASLGSESREVRSAKN